MSGSIYSWSTTATDNDDADGDIDWSEGQNAKTVNNSARQMMGRLAEFLLDLGGQGTVGGTANAITLTLESSFTALKSGLICAIQPTADNTGAVTLNVNGIGAKAIRKFDTTGEVALASGDLQDGNFYLLTYDTAANSSAGAWIVLNPTPQEYQAKNSKLTDIAALTATDGNFIVGNGTTWVAESGATARTSLGLGSAATTASTAYATSAQGTKADGATQKTDLASTSASKGASLVGVQDSDGNFTGTTVETVLSELYGLLLGVGQTWQDVSSSRAINTTYTNSTGKPIQANVSITAANAASAALQVYDGTNWLTAATSSGNIGRQSGSIIIPPNGQYRVSASGGGGFIAWLELR